jgi:hypothetical protein
MAIIKVNNYVDVYKMRAHSSDPHKLAGRDGREAVTDFVTSQILERLDLQPQDILIDIGCGDGRLLKNSVGVASRIGTVGSTDECMLLKKSMPDITFKACLATGLHLETASATKIVCNGVLLYMQSTDEVEQALSEIKRIAKPDALIWVGEIPAANEYAEYKMYIGDSVLGLLWFLLRNHGLRTFLGMCRKLIMSLFGQDQVVLNSAGIYWSSPQNFIALAERHGLRLETYFKHREFNANGDPADSKYRFDYIFRK